MGLLQSIGIELPASTKLSEDHLEKKFATALTLSQHISSGQIPINPLTLPMWKTENGNVPASQAIYRTSHAELTKRMELPLDHSFPLYENSFMDARGTLLELTKAFTELGKDVVILNDPKGVEAICIRILEIYELKTDTPLVALLYLSADKSTPPENTASFAHYHMQRLGHMPQIMCAQGEQALLRKLLFQNHQRLSSEFQPAKQRFEQPFKPSFLLPLNPLSQIDIGKLSHTGCEVCGAKTTSRCTQCLMVSYCGKVCQREHWPKHKALCKAMKAGTWIPVKFQKYIVIDGKRMDSGIANTAGPLDMDKVVYNDQEDSSPPPNTHGDRPFLVKIQKLKYAPADAIFNPSSRTDDLHFMTDKAGNPNIPHPDGLLVYDRSRPFYAFVMQAEDAKAYGVLSKEIAARNHRDKIYRWAKRSGDFEFSICWDRAPGEPAW
ncbi:hypothetical protein BDZ89DRAFT_199724 [Hymenopellis radicata]|nr:hypothetical protein BDZ89DRAFT_199724 [Hymenopellis radicata]